MRYKKPYKCTGWAIVATIERKDGTWYTDTITEIDDDTASSVDTFLNEYIDEKNEDESQANKQRGHKMKNYYVGVSDITFYLTDEDGNIKEDKNGNEINYRLKDGIRFKPLEYITESIEVDMLEKAQANKQKG